MKLNCFHRGDAMTITAELTPTDLPKLEILFNAIRGMLEIDSDFRHREMTAADLDAEAGT